MTHILLAVALFASEAVVAQAPSGEDDIVVIAQKLDKLKIRYGGGHKNGVIVANKCRVTRSSGDADVDAIGCGAVSYCTGQRLSKSAEFNRCVNDHAKIMAAELHDRRIRARDAL